MTAELPQNIKPGSSETQIDKLSSSWLPPGLALKKVDERIMTLNVGPQHPGSGHMRLIVQIDGDYIVACDPDLVFCGNSVVISIVPLLQSPF